MSHTPVDNAVTVMPISCGGSAGGISDMEGARTAAVAQFSEEFGNVRLPS